jgi:hypothetical protein
MESSLSCHIVAALYACSGSDDLACSWLFKSQGLKCSKLLEVMEAFYLNSSLAEAAGNNAN